MALSLWWQNAAKLCGPMTVVDSHKSLYRCFGVEHTLFGFKDSLGMHLLMGFISGIMVPASKVPSFYLFSHAISVYAEMCLLSKEWPQGWLHSHFPGPLPKTNTFLEEDYKSEEADSHQLVDKERSELLQDKATIWGFSSFTLVDAETHDLVWKTHLPPSTSLLLSSPNGCPWTFSMVGMKVRCLNSNSACVAM